MDLGWAPHNRGSPSAEAEGQFRDLVRSSLLASFRNEPPFYDEPKPWSLSATLLLGPHLTSEESEADNEREFGFAGACSFSFDKSLNRLCGEAAERFALLPPASGTALREWRSFEPGKALDPQRIVAGARPEPPDRSGLRLEWTSARDLMTGATIELPAQLINVPHLFSVGEQVIRAPITTGAAVGWSLEECVYRGLAEIIERDSFMVNWLLGPRGRNIQVSGDERHRTTELADLAGAVGECRRFRLRPLFAELLTVEALSVVVCALFDDTGIGPYFSLGGSASHSVPLAALKALEEALQLRLWLRSERESIVRYADERRDKTSPSTIRSRAALCFEKGYSEELASLLSFDEAASEPLQIAHAPSLQDLLATLGANGASAYAVDLTERLPGELSEVGIRAAKVVVPELQPLYLTEALADFAWGRLALYRNRFRQYAECDLRTLPHPFL
jgi:thiazole/oxazole-forming peptide maturase SagD family component